MLNRIYQFVSAMTAHLSPQDIDFVKHHLDVQEQNLFFSMDLPTQYHCLNVAKTSMQLAARHQGVNNTLLLKGALLHDIGKPAGELSTLYRVAIVLTNALYPKLGKMLANPSKLGFWGSLRHAFYIQQHHAHMGAIKAENAGLSEELINLIAHHHEAFMTSNLPELQLLKESDGVN